MWRPQISGRVNFAFSYAGVSKWSAWGQPWGTAPLNRFPSPGGSPPEREKGQEDYEDILTNLTEGPLPQPIPHHLFRRGLWGR